MRSPLRWLGGKSGLIKRILPLLPPHDLYCEPFGGSAAVLLAKPRSKVEVYCDADKRLINFFRVIQHPDTFERFMDQVCSMPYSREERERARLDPPSPDPVVMAMRLFVLSRQSFGGLVDKTAWGFISSTDNRAQMAQTARQWLQTIRRMPAVHRRLQGVKIARKTWEKTLGAVDRPGALIYLDPPYVPETRRDGHYKHEMTMEDHEALVERLMRLRAAVVLSGYPHEIYAPLEAAGWRRRDFDVACMVVARTKATGLQGTGAIEQQRRTECCWTSPRRRRR